MTAVTAQLAADAVIADLAGRSTDAPFDAERLASLRAVFVAAGTAALHEALTVERWIELSLPLDPLEPCWIALMTSELPLRLDAWVRAGRVRCAFFMNKPPGIRLRLLAPREDLLLEATTLLDELCARGVVGSWSRGPYDAEAVQFGGPAGLALAHRYFTHESLAVLAHHRARLTRGVGLPPAELSLVLLHMFLRRVTDDDWELWDLWCKMEVTGRLPSGGRVDPATPEVASALALRPHLLPLLRDDEAALAHATAAEASALRHYAEALPAIARDLRAVRTEGRLAWGLREILPFWIVFHWNRMGFDDARQERLAHVMSTVLNPKL